MKEEGVFVCTCACGFRNVVSESWISLTIYPLNFMASSGLGILVVAYVDAINTGDVPCLENAVTTLAQLENSAAVQKAADLYSEQMAQRLSLPADTYLELLEVHADCECEAIAVFMEHSFKDDTQEFQKMLVVSCLTS